MVLRAFVAAAVATVCGGAVVQRKRERALEKEIARLQSARVRDEWRTDEKIAELESALDEYRAGRDRAEQKLAARRSELAGLRGEYAALLKRYALAELERAAALEDARLALEPAPAPPSLTPSAYLRANAALDALEVEGDAARQRERREDEEERPADASSDTDLPSEAQEDRRTGEPEEGAAGNTTEEGAAGRRRDAEQHARAGTGAGTLSPARSHGPTGAAVAVVPLFSSQQDPHGAPEPDFDFFGAQRVLSASAETAVEVARGDDLADVVGDELAPQGRPADRAAGGESGSGEPAGEVAEPPAAVVGLPGSGRREEGAQGDPPVIDLTEHDETEPIDVSRLRAFS